MHSEQFRSSQRSLEDLSDIFSTNYGFKVVNAIETPDRIPITVDLIVSKLDLVYDSLMQEQDPGNTGNSIQRKETRWTKLTREITMDHIISTLTSKERVKRLREKIDKPFQYCNQNLSSLYTSGYRDIFGVLKLLKSYPKLYQSEYKFVMKVLMGIRTDRALDTLELVKQKDWKDKYLQK